MTLSNLPLFAAMVLPVFPSNWWQLAGLVALSALLLLLSFYLCAYAPSASGTSADPWNALGCLVVTIAGGVVAIASAAIGALRVVGKARDWAWARVPGVLVPAAVLYLGAGLILAAMLTLLRY